MSDSEEGADGAPADGDGDGDGDAPSNTWGLMPSAPWVPPDQATPPPPSPSWGPPAGGGYPPPPPTPYQPTPYQPTPYQPASRQPSPFVAYAPRPARRKNNGMAVASLVAGVVGLFSCFFPALALTAIAFGHVSLRQLKREADRERGRGLAVAGLVLGYATLLLSIGFWVLVATTDTTDTTDVPDPTPATSIAGFGSDPQLDALARDCEGGDFPACDRLWLQGTEGSSYEDYGDTCGGRQELSPDASSIFHERCTEAFPVES